MQQFPTTSPEDDTPGHDEADLVHTAREDPAAFEMLYHRYRDRVYGYLRTRTTTDEDAADLTQHVFLRVLDALPQYQARRGPFAPWLFGIARNMAVDFHRRRRVTVALDLVPLALQIAAEDDVEAAALRHEAFVRLSILFRALDADRRELLILRFVAKLTVANIAALIGKREDATRKYLARTLHMLKEQYDDTAF